MITIPEKNDPDPVEVLIVDDDFVCRLFCTDVLQSAGFATLAACSGAAAVELALSRRPRIILLDQHLPDLSGFEVARMIRQAWPESSEDCCLIAITAADPQASVGEANQDVFPTMLNKPFSPTALVHAVRDLSGSGKLMPDFRPFVPLRTPLLAGIEDPGSLNLQSRFLRALRKELEQLDLAISALDWRKSEILTHRMAGAAALAGFHQFASCCRSLLDVFERDEATPDLADTYLKLLNQAAELKPVTTP